MWCVGKIDNEYIERMEDILDLYEKSLNSKEPVVCLDEKPVQLLEEARSSIPAAPFRVTRKDYEYRRRGTANVFCAVEPKAGRHFTRVTPNRKGPAFARMIRRLYRAYRSAKKIHLVVDNLSTHTAKSLTGTFGSREGMRIWNKFQVHHTPKHGSWLNQAEIEISLFSREALGSDRVGDLSALRRRASAWNKRANRKKRKISWTFTKRKARKKMKYAIRA